MPDPQRCLIVGANSFLARAIAERLAPDGHALTGLVNQRTDNLHPALHPVPVSALPLLPTDAFDVVYFISAHIPPKNQPLDHSALYDVNVALPARVSARFPGARLVYASSVSIYGDLGSTAAAPLSEGSAVTQPGAYGLSKLWGETIVRQHPGGHGIVRIASMYGSGMSPTTFLPAVVRSALSTGTIRLLGQGERQQNYVHVADVAELCVRAATAASGTWLAVSPTSHANRTVAELIRATLPDTVIEFTGDDLSPSFFYDATSTYQALGFTPQVALTDGLSELIQWQQNAF